jgi:ribosomal protein S18 acetylase RimI-like enzyme
MPLKLVESVNSLTASEFFQKYLIQDDIATITSNNASPEERSLHVTLIGTCDSLTAENEGLLEQCLQLIKSTSAEDYRNSEMKWSVYKKRKEMHLPDMRYLILVENNADPSVMEPKVAGFVSFMITYEDGKQVVYCYEIHLNSPWQGKGIGKKLMAIVERIGRRVGMEKSMLTVFKTNARAVKMYESIGYREDEFSPGPRKLRNGTVKEPKYVILSKDLRTST